MDFRFGDGSAPEPLAAELRALHPDVVVAVARPGVPAMRAATAPAPIPALTLPRSVLLRADEAIE
jgi:hypothetical protein